MIKQIKLYFNLIFLNRIKTYIVLEKAKERIKNDDDRFCCNAINSILDKYLIAVDCRNISKIIFNFNSKYLTGKEIEPRHLWWKEYDKKSRIKALDKLIKEYKESGEYIYYKDAKKLENYD